MPSWKSGNRPSRTGKGKESLEMRHVVIVAACRTAIGALGGAFRSKSALDLTIPVMQALVQRSDLGVQLSENL